MLNIAQIRGLRLKAGITQKDFAELMEVPIGTWSNVEIGNHPLYAEFASKAENIFKELGVLTDEMEEIPTADARETRWVRADTYSRRKDESTPLEDSINPIRHIEEKDKDDRKNDALRPYHYHKGGMDLFQFLELKWTPAQLEAFYAGNVLKYVLRYDNKNGLEDLQKAKVYLEELIKLKQQGE